MNSWDERYHPNRVASAGMEWVSEFGKAQRWPWHTMTISQLKQERQKSDGRVQDLLRQNSKLQAIRKAMDFLLLVFMEGWYAEGTCDLSKVCCNFSSLRYNQNYIFLLTLDTAPLQRVLFLLDSWNPTVRDIQTAFCNRAVILRRN
jgi:hypothetical protein